MCLDSFQRSTYRQQDVELAGHDFNICRSTFYNQMFNPRNTLYVHVYMCHNVHVRVTQPYTLTQGHACGRE
jgi:hypothetical protein